LWFLHHFVSLNPAYVQTLGHFFAVKEAKDLKGRFVSKRAAGSRVNMGEHKINAVLCKAVKRVRVWYDILYIVVIVFDMRFLA
jgi:hypothetical protein